jgi:hypothetical protein
MFPARFCHLLNAKTETHRMAHLPARFSFLAGSLPSWKVTQRNYLLSLMNISLE